MREPVFVLGPGRSFTSVIGAMLGQHPQLYGLPETNLATAETVGQWLQILPGMTAFPDGVLRLLASLHHGEQSAEAVAEVQGWLQARPAMTTAEIYNHAETLVQPRRLVDKSPLHVSTDACLARLSRLAPDAKYLRIARHPWSNGRSIVATGWYMDGLRSWGSSAWDRRSDPPVLDPQFHWLDIHDRIDRFFATLAPQHWRTVRGEDLLADPRSVLRRIAGWLEIDDSDAAIAEMLHPERSPFARPGPPNARLGNDPGFVESPALRPFTPPQVPLSARLPWRGDMQGFAPEVVARALRFGYQDAPLLAPALPAGLDGTWGPLIALEPDGDGFPMTHGNLLDNSCVTMPPLLSVRSVTHLPRPAYGGGNLGAYTASDYAVAVFDSPREPALQAIDLQSGDVLWETEPGLMPMPADTLRGRFVGGLLLARLVFANGRTRRCIFAGNRVELVCLDIDGSVLWRRDTRDIIGLFGPGAREHGTPRCLRPTRDNAIVYGTRNGYAGKLDPLTGQTLDIVDLRTAVDHGGRRIQGHCIVRQSIILHGDHAFFQVKFTPDSDSEDDAAMPTVLMRLQVSGTADGRMERPPAHLSATGAANTVVIGTVGDRRVGGSPGARLREDGNLVIFTNEFPDANGAASGPPGSEFQFCGVRDEGGRLVRQWRCRLRDAEDAKVTAAPAIDQMTDTLIATSRKALLIFAKASWREGEIRPDAILNPLDCLGTGIAESATAAEFSSALTIAREPLSTAFIVYVGLAVWTSRAPRPFSVLTALEVATEPALSVRPIWSRSIRVDQAGNDQPASRSFAQPALFATRDGGRDRPGLVMGTMMDGLAIFR